MNCGGQGDLRAQGLVISLMPEAPFRQRQRKYAVQLRGDLSRLVNSHSGIPSLDGDLTAKAWLYPSSAYIGS